MSIGKMQKRRGPFGSKVTALLYDDINALL